MKDTGTHREDPGRPAGPAPTIRTHSSARAFLKILTSFDREARVPALTALRNSAGMVLSFSLGSATGVPFGGPAAGCGALLASYSDGIDPYRRRAVRMIGASCTLALAALVGGLSAHHPVAAPLIAAAAALIVGMAAAYGTTAASIGTVSLVLLTIFSGQTFTVRSLSEATGLVLGAGLLQSLLSLALWPVRGYEPERQALALLYLELARIATEPLGSGDAPPATARTSQVRQSLLSSLRQDVGEEGLRYRSLLTQAERARLCVITLLRMQTELIATEPWMGAAQTLARFLSSASRALADIGRLLGGDAPIEAGRPTELNEATEAWRSAITGASPSPHAIALKDTLHQMEALAGQLRAAALLAAGVAAKEGAPPPSPQHPSTPAARSLAMTLRANLNLRSTVLRHALRLSICLTTASVLAHAIGWRHSYWIPMTVILVLRPDFASTFSRGLQRIAGTILGLLGATALFHYLSPTVATLATAVGVCVFLLRWLGQVNYVFLTLGVTGAIVMMLALAGAAPDEVAPDRLIDTLIGGLLALSAYALWPTREPVNDVLLKLLAAYRDYFVAVTERILRPHAGDGAEAARRRLAARLARSNLEASILRLAAEPATKASEIDLLRAMMASSHRLVHAVMGIDAVEAERAGTPATPQAGRFAADIRSTFSALEAMLMGREPSAADLPDLRNAFRAMCDAADQRPSSLRLQIEGDALVNSLNTLHEQILLWREERKGRLG